MGANQETLMYTLEKSIKKKADLFEHSFSAYAVRSILASLYLGLGIVISLYTADKLNHVAEGLGKFSYGLMFGWGLLIYECRTWNIQHDVYDSSQPSKNDSY